MAETREDILARNKALADQIGLLEQKAELEIKLNKIAQNGISRFKTQADLYKQQTILLRESAVRMTALVEKSKELASSTGEYATEEEALQALMSQRQKQIDEILKEEEEAYKKGKELTDERKKDLALLKIEMEAFDDATADGITSLEDFGKNIKKNLDFAQETAGLMEATNAVTDLADQFDQSTQNILGLNNEWNQGSLTGRMLDAIGKGADLSDSFEAIGERMKETLNPTALLAQGIIGLVHGSMDLTEKLNDAFGEFKQTTGGGEQYLDVISDATGENYQFGISAQESMQGLQALYTELAMFSSLSEEVQTQLTDLSGKLKVMGVDAAQTAASADLLMQSVGYTADEFEGFQQSLRSMSNAIGVPMNQLNEQFVQAADVVGKYGKQGVEEFRKLAAAAKATGIEMGSLLDIAGQFDTFESAAEQVGSLNAILGGAYFDTVQMVNATEEERIDLLRRGVQASGKTFDQLGRYEKKAIAAAAGIQDINEANKLFGKSTAAYEELQMLAGDASMSLADLSDEAFNTLSPMEKFQAVLRKFQKPLDFLLKGLDYVATALFTVVSFIEDVAKWFGFTGEGITIFVVSIMAMMFKFGGVLTFIFGLLKGLGVGIMALVAKIPAIGAALTSLGPALASMSSGLSAAGTAALAAAKPLMMVGIAIGAAGLGIGAAAFGLAELVKAFSGLDGAQIVGALTAIALVMGGMVGMMMLFATVGMPAAAAALALGAAMLLMGAGIALAAYGFSLLVNSISGIPLDTIWTLVTAVGILASAGLFAGLGLAGIAVGIAAVGAALFFITDNEIQLLTHLFDAIGGIRLDSALAINEISSSLSGLTDVEIPVKMVSFMEEMGKIPDSEGLKSAASFVTAVSKTTPEAAAAAKSVMDAAVKLATVEVNSDNAELIQAIAKLTQAVGQIKPAAAATSSSSRSNGGELQVNVSIDGKKAWQGIKPHYEKELRGY